MLASMREKVKHFTTKDFIKTDNSPKSFQDLHLQKES
jgi:hypothetical protein